MFKEKIKSFFSIENNSKTVIISLIIAFIVGFASYSAFIVYGFASPDGVLEGLHFYTNRHWAIAGCGRWFLALLNILHANLVFPWLVIIECILTNWLSAHTLCKIFKIDKKAYYYSFCALFIVLPAFIEMNLYTNSSFSFSISILFSIMFVYFNLFNNKYLIVVSGLLLGCAMGSYQSQIGIAVGLTLMSLIFKVLNKENDKLRFFITSLISGILALVVYICGLKAFLEVFNLKLYSRASTFSLSAIFVNFIPRLIYTYQEFFNTFNQIILKRWIIYIVIFVVLIIECFVIVIKQLKNKEYINASLFIVLILLLPAALNIIGIILPNEPITHMMTTPDYIIIPFVLCLGKYTVNITKTVTYYVLSICVACLTWTYVLSANATYDCYRMSYNLYKSKFSYAMDKVYELDNYQVNSTRIIVIGVPDDSKLREMVPMYNYAIRPYHNLLYWGSPELDPIATRIYIINEFGIDPGVMEYEEYDWFINLPECLEMPSWPNEGFVRMVNDCAIIKFGEVYE